MKKTQCYETTDGELFINKEAAQRHQNVVDMMKVLEDHNVDWNSTSSHEVCNIIASNFTIYKQ